MFIYTAGIFLYIICTILLSVFFILVHHYLHSIMPTITIVQNFYCIKWLNLVLQIYIIRMVQSYLYSIESIVVVLYKQLHIHFKTSCSGVQEIQLLCYRPVFQIGALLSLTNKTKIIMSESKGGSASRKKEEEDSTKMIRALDIDTQWLIGDL